MRTISIADWPFNWHDCPLLCKHINIRIWLRMLWEIFVRWSVYIFDYPQSFLFSAFRIQQYICFFSLKHFLLPLFDSTWSISDHIWPNTSIIKGTVVSSLDLYLWFVYSLLWMHFLINTVVHIKAVIDLLSYFSQNRRESFLSVHS